MCTLIHPVEEAEELLQWAADGQLQEVGKLLQGDAATLAGLGDGTEALQFLLHVVPLEAEAQNQQRGSADPPRKGTRQ